jgi:crotonobetainyl-CoA:carnitine CoA-transferase CaiB-like acyl-CoA transferase
MQLADLGADVVKVERPGSGDETRQWGPPFADAVATYFLAVNRGKRSITVDLASEAGRQIVWDLLSRADVVVSNFRPGVMSSLGLSREEVATRRPRVIYCQINGYGDRGELAQRAAFDLVIQAESGLMDLTGAPGAEPTKAGISIADEIAGLYLVQGVLAALLERARTGTGRLVEVALFDAMMSMFTYQAQQFLTASLAPQRMGNNHPSLVPYRPFDTADEPVVVGVASDDLWDRFCGATGLTHLADDPRYRSNADRVRDRSGLEATIATRMRQLPAAEWVRRLDEAGVPCGRIRSLAQALGSEAATEREIVQQVEGGDLRYVRSPLRFGHAGPGARRPPGLGEHTTEILSELGYEAAKIARLRAVGAI